MPPFQSNRFSTIQAQRIWQSSLNFLPFIYYINRSKFEVSVLWEGFLNPTLYELTDLTLITRLLL